MKFSRCIAGLFAIVALTSNTSSAQSIHLVTEPFPPLNMTITDSTYGRNQKVTGFATEIVREVFNRTSSDLEITLYASWDRGFNKALTKQNYGIYSTFRTPERESKFKWVGPLFMEDWIILANPKSNIKISKLEDLNKYRVGSFESDSISDYLKEKGVKIETAQNDVVNATKLKLNKIDLWATSSLSGPYIAKRHQLNLKNVYTFNSNGLWLAMNKSTDDQTIQQLNATLKQMKTKGEVKEIISQYK